MCGDDMPIRFRDIAKKREGGQKIPPSRACIKTFDYILNTLALGAFFCETVFLVWNCGTFPHSYVISGWLIEVNKFSFSQNSWNWCTRRPSKFGDDPPIRFGAIAKKREGAKIPPPVGRGLNYDWSTPSKNYFFIFGIMNKGAPLQVRTTETTLAFIG